MIWADMQGRRRVGSVGVVVALGVVVAASAYAAPARLTRAGSVLDRTYSCRVRAQRYVDLAASVKLPPSSQTPPKPASLSVTTLKTGIQRNGVLYYVPQVLFESVKDSLHVDRSTCRTSSRRAALRPGGLPAGQTATPTNLVSNFEERCVTAKRVLVHFRITMNNGTPALALVAVRNDDRKSRPVAFFRWRASKITGYLGKTCVSTGG